MEIFGIPLQSFLGQLLLGLVNGSFYAMLSLGLAVIDEQHKFGVRQRSALRQGEIAPHYLVMTATPIPRTLSMTLFGDLDISTLQSAPAGRQPPARAPHW